MNLYLVVYIRALGRPTVVARPRGLANPNVLLNPAQPCYSQSNFEDSHFSDNSRIILVLVNLSLITVSQPTGSLHTVPRAVNGWRWRDRIWWLIIISKPTLVMLVDGGRTVVYSEAAVIESSSAAA